MSKEKSEELDNWHNVAYRMDNEGLEYCFKHYSSFEEIEDEEFHAMRKSLLHQMDAIRDLVEKRIKNIDETDKYIERGCCSECGEGYDNEPEWLYNTECEVCGHPIPDNLIIKKS